MKRRERWYSNRVESDVTVVRWGHFGRPVIVFPTAGGDAEEIERRAASVQSQAGGPEHQTT